MLIKSAYGVHATSRLGIETTRKDFQMIFFYVQSDAVDIISRLLTEFGWSLVRWEDGKEITEQGHLVVQERRRYTNTYVPNNREVEKPLFLIANRLSDVSDQRYNFGETKFVDKNEFKERIQCLISDLTKSGPLYLVFHDNNQDIK